MFKIPGIFIIDHNKTIIKKRFLTYMVSKGPKFITRVKEKSFFYNGVLFVKDKVSFSRNPN